MGLLMSLICDGAVEAHNVSQPVLYKVVVVQATNYLKCNSASEFQHGIRATVEQTCIELERRGESELQKSGSVRRQKRSALVERCS